MEIKYVQGVNNAKETGSLYLDGWTSRNHYHIIVLIYHFLDRDMNAKELLLSANELEDRETGDNILVWLESEF